MDGRGDDDDVIIQIIAHIFLQEGVRGQVPVAVVVLILVGILKVKAPGGLAVEDAQGVVDLRQHLLAAATGTGKSFIGFKLCYDNSDKVICWLSPSRYIYQTQLENLKEASGGYEPHNVKFYTYAKLMLLSDENFSEIKPDYIILDEFHRCGAEYWGMGVQKLLEMYPDTPLLGLSATAIRYLDNQRDMTDELFDGNIASEMTLGDAIVRGILDPPKYILSIFSYQKDLDEYEKTKDRGFISIPTGNHDLARISYGRTNTELEVIFAFIMTMPGIPFVYYGDEIGMEYIPDMPSKEGGFTRTGSRTPMQWKKGKNAGFSDGAKELLYLPVNENGVNVEEQLGDENSLLNKVKELIALRKTTQALSASGGIEFLNRKNGGYPLVYKRMSENEQYLICINPSNEDKRFEMELCVDVIMQNGNIKISEGEIVLGAVSYTILKLK